MIVVSDFGVNAVNQIIRQSWDYDPPNILAISQPLADEPNLPLSGGCTTRMPLDKYIKDLELDLKRKEGHYYAYVMNSEGGEADTFVLRTWQVCRPDDGIFEAVVILYYAALNQYMALRKHMGEEMARQYLKEQSVRNQLSTLISE